MLVTLSRRLCLVAALCTAAAVVPACRDRDASSDPAAPDVQHRARDRAQTDVQLGARDRAQKGPFIIGVWVQPSSSFAKWRARGINTVVGLDLHHGLVSYRQWRAELERQDLYAIRQPRRALSQDARDPRLLAWMQTDGPDSADNSTDPAVLKRLYRRWKTAAPGVPVFLNFCGSCVLAGNHSEERYRDWIAASDWVSNNLYPVNSNHPEWIDLRRDPEPPIGRALDILKSWSHGKRQIEIVEASNQEIPLSRRAPTSAELRGMIWHSIIHGASGIVYFPQRVGDKFDFDAVPPKLVAEMKRINSSISRLAAVLLSRGRRTQAPKPFERAIRVRGRRVYSIVLNLSHRAAYYHGRRYGPFEVRVSPR